MQARRELNDPENAIIGAFAEEREKKKREKKNLESGAALRQRDPSPVDDFFSLRGKKERGDIALFLFFNLY
ncbi:hypothetical protein B296_00047723 [Ensete ventricosum]|uniref:Uncharacterized protein n=1 Tax=Ensete ventricosum TaxID=4639 RepID=A0A426YTH4_ENSVE|nr:hypothetical protein B296_00047723 [Ensete ventricosum]